MDNERRFYTYAYLREDGTPYYIGKGTGNRAFERRGRKSAQTPKDKSRILFLKRGLTEKEAFRHEKYLIAVFGRKDLGTGILRNLSEGGEGPANPAEATREKMRKGGRTNKLRTQKAVELTRMSNGEVFVFSCVWDAARSLNLTRANLCAVSNGRRLSAGGFLARYWTPDLDDWGGGLFHKVKEVEQKKKESCQNRGKASQSRTQKAVEITRISDGMIFVFDSVGDAARARCLNPSSLSKVCRGERKSTGGFTARYLSPGEFTG